ncbi:hypothetical protein E1A91_D09G097900v1 [Gossypium mustelinum]|uniref:Thioesterase domain-containing protein n=1 Tax=Gossypium mustelinum TaxID=34275 RepID=A0A5D2THD6_GOSMU|nr:hypothetical protein E1A91_D09G097900v1 [Gossypium mustelinum]
MEGGDSLKKSLAWLHGVINGKIGHGLETRVLQGLHVTHTEKGFMRFDFLVPNAVSLVDIIGLVTVYSFANRVTSTVDLNVLYYSTTTIQEHVEIESKVSANRGKLMHTVVEVRRKGNGEVIAIGKLWMALNKLTPQVSNL